MAAAFHEMRKEYRWFSLLSSTFEMVIVWNGFSKFNINSYNVFVKIYIPQNAFHFEISFFEYLHFL